MKSRFIYELTVTDGTTTVKNPKTLTVSSMTASSGNVTLGETESSSTSMPTTAMRILSTTGHISHGYYWKPDRKYFDFYYDALVRPFDTQETGYLISAGYGGAHNLLWGFYANDTHFQVTGNIWDGAATKTFSTPIKFPLGQWYHIAVAWNRKVIVTYVNGVAEGSTAYVADYRSTPGVDTPVLFVGGSNHSKFDMDIAWIRGFESIVPFDIGLAKPFRPQRWPSANFSDAYKASFLADYTKPAYIIPDLSDGLADGIEQVISNTVVVTTVNAGNAKCVVTADGLSGSPVTVTFAVANSDTASQVATKARAALVSNTAVNEFFVVGGSNAVLQLTARIPQAHDATMNLTIEDDTSSGITDDTTATVVTRGYAGTKVRHPGIREGLIGTTGAFIDANATNESEGQMPTWVDATIAKPSAVTENAPAGSPLIYDNFTRISVPFWDNTVSLGSTEGGSLGVQTWTGASSSYGTSASRAYYNLEGYGSPVFVDPAQQDVEVRFTQENGLTAYLRYADTDNYISLQASGAALYITKRIGGTNTSVFSDAVIGAPPSDIRVTVVGNNIVVTYNGVEKVNETTALPTGTKVGFLLTSYGLERMDAIAIYDA